MIDDRMSVVSPEREASYVSIIDCILATSDLNTISEKRIRKGLEVAVNDDLTDQKVNPGHLSPPDREQSTYDNNNDDWLDRHQSPDHRSIRQVPRRSERCSLFASR